MKKKTSKLAIANLGLGIVMPFFLMGAIMLESGFLVILSLCLPILAVLIGSRAWYEIWKSKGELGGIGLVIVGWLLIAGVLFFPGINGGLVPAEVLKVGNNGKNIVLSIISANDERKVLGLNSVWPSVSSDFSGVQKDYTQVPDSETYFADLMDAGVLPESSWYLFAGAGITAATNRESFLQGNHNVWNVLAGLDENASDDTPFMFTRNLNITEADLRDETISFGSKLDRKIKPFGDQQVVFIMKGGAMVCQPKKYLRSNRHLFLGSAVFNDEINRNAKVLKAKSND